MAFDFSTLIPEPPPSPAHFSDKAAFAEALDLWRARERDRIKRYERQMLAQAVVVGGFVLTMIAAAPLAMATAAMAVFAR